MTKLLATLATLKAILIAASVALARGDTLPVVLITALLTLAQIAARPPSQARLVTTITSSNGNSSSGSRARTDRADPGQTVL